MWGVIPHRVEAGELADPSELARERASSLGLASSGDFVLLVRGFDTEPSKSTPSITLLRV